MSFRGTVTQRYKHVTLLCIVDVFYMLFCKYLFFSSQVMCVSFHVTVYIIGHLVFEWLSVY